MKIFIKLKSGKTLGGYIVGKDNNSILFKHEEIHSILGLFKWVKVKTERIYNNSISSYYDGKMYYMY